MLFRSHVKNGIYGARWVAAMLAAAAVESDVCRVLEIGLTEIPGRSRLAEAVREVRGWAAAGVDYHAAVARVHARWDENQAHDWCHVIANAQVVALGLLYGDGDFERAVTRAVYPGFDTDCNGATVGSLMGMLLGAAALPRKWTAVLHDRLRTGLSGFASARISALGRELFALSRAVRARPA